jgi:hypothetical protein
MVLIEERTDHAAKRNNYARTIIIIMETLFNNFVIYYIYTIVNLTN